MNLSAGSTGFVPGARVECILKFCCDTYCRYGTFSYSCAFVGYLNLVYAPGTRTECLTAQQKKERDAANERDVPSDMEIKTGPQTGQTEKER